MKRKGCIISIILIALLTITTTCFGFEINMNLNKTKDIKAGDEITLTIKPNETIIGASFKMDYDSDNLELSGSDTDNLSVSENNGKIAAVYVDTLKTGTNSLKIKFKVKNDINSEVTFSLEETKFVSLEGETTYNQDDITGVEKTISVTKSSQISNSGNEVKNETNNTSNTTKNITNTSNSVNSISNNSTLKTNTTTSSNDIPYTGTSQIILIAMAITLTTTIYFGIKLRKN
jgi:hypothetical protein